MENKDQKRSGWDIYDFDPSKVDPDSFTHNLFDECDKNIQKTIKKLILEDWKIKTTKGRNGIYTISVQVKSMRTYFHTISSMKVKKISKNRLKIDF